MSVSDRYREIARDVQSMQRMIQGEGEAAEPAAKSVGQAVEELAELLEGVGDIPRNRLESQLTPVLLKAHGRLDRARLLLDEQGAEDRAAAVWELEQKIYRLLNDL